MKNKGKYLIIGAILGVGAALVIRNVLKENPLDDIKEGVKGNIDKATDVIEDNIEKAKDSIQEYNKENTSNTKIEF